MSENYEALVNGIIQRAMEDYVNSVRRLKHLEAKKQKAIADNGKFRPRKPGESLDNYKRTMIRHSVPAIEKSIEEAKEELRNSEEFFHSDWLKQISFEIDGEQILEKVKQRLKKEGYEV